jgi:hypothetical protein
MDICDVKPRSNSQRVFSVGVMKWNVMEPFCTWHPSSCSVRQKSGMEPFLETEYSAQIRNRVVSPNWWNVLVPPTPNLSLTENKKITTPNLFLPPRFHSSIHQSRWRTDKSVGRRRIAGARRSGRRRSKLRANESTAAGRQASNDGGSCGLAEQAGAQPAAGRQASDGALAEQAGALAEQAGGRRAAENRSTADGNRSTARAIGRWRRELVNGDGNCSMTDGNWWMADGQALSKCMVLE